MKTKLVEYVWGHPNVALVYPMAAYLEVAKLNYVDGALRTLQPFTTETVLRHLEHTTESEMQLRESTTTAAAWVGLHDEDKLKELLGNLSQKNITLLNFPEARKKLKELVDYPFTIDIDKKLPASLENGKHDDIHPSIFDQVLAQEIYAVQKENRDTVDKDPELERVLGDIDIDLL